MQNITYTIARTISIKSKGQGIFAYLLIDEKEHMNGCVNLIDRIKLMSKWTNSVGKSFDNRLHGR